MSRIEQMGSYKNSYYDITPSIARVIEKVDKERIEVAKLFFDKPRTMLKIMQSLYNLPDEKCTNFYETIMNIQAYKIQFSPNNMKHRYVSEDVPYSLVPIATIAKLYDIKTPNMDSIINLACMCNNEDYWSTGRNTNKLGLGKVHQQI